MKKKLSLILAAALTIGVLATMAAIAAIIYLHRQTRDDQSDIAQNLARSIANTVERDVAGIDHILQMSADEIERQQTAHQATYDSVTTFLSRQQDRFSTIDLLRATDPEGATVYGRGVDPTQRASLAQRDYYKQLKENPKLGMVISEPVIGKISQKWIWLMARRLNHPDQSFAGLVYASIFVDDLVKRFEEFKLVPGSAISLRDQNMKVVARTTFDATPPLPIGDSRLSEELQQALSRPSMSGTYQSGATTADGVSRIYAYQRSEKYGFTLLVGIPNAYITHLWLQQSAFVATLLITFLVGLLFGTRLVSRRIADQLRVDINATREAERALLKTLVRSIPNPIWLKDPDGVYLACNVEFERFFGHPESAIVGKTDDDFVAPDLAKFFRDHDRAAMAAGKPTVNEEWITYASDGHHAYLVTTKTPMYGPDGSIIGVLGVAQDITEMRRQEELLRDSRETLNRAQSVAHVGSWRFDIEADRLEGSDEAYRIFGITIGTPLTLAHFLACIHPDDLAQVAAARKAALGGVPYDIKHRIVLEGAVRWVHELAAIERDANGKALRGLGTVQDITVQQEAAQELAQSRALLNAVIDSVPVRIFWKDRNSRYLGCNPLFARDAGKSTPDEVIGKLDDDLHWAEQADRYRADDRQVMASGISKLNDEQPQTMPDGQLIYVRTSIVPLRVGQSEVSGVLGIYDDITERRHTEAQLREGEERFRALFEASRDAIYLHDGPTIIDCNQAALNLLGHSERSEIVGKTPGNRAAPDPHDPRDAELRAAERVSATLAGVPQQFEWLARKSDGTDVLLDVQLTRVDIGGRPHIQAIARDITERKKAELALQEERHVRDTILESIPGIFYAINADGFLTFWNHNFQRATGRSAEELQNCNAADLFEGEHRAHIMERIKQTFVQGKSDAEADLVSAGGLRTRYYFTGRRIEMGGSPILVGVGVDVGPLKAAEQNLRRLNEQLEERVRQNTADLKASYAKLRDTEFAMDSVGIGIHWVDFDSGRFIHANRFAAELLGYSHDELLQRTVSGIDPHFPPAAFREINDRIRQSGYLKFETEQIKRDGSYVPVEMTVYYHAGDGITPPRMISFMQDITDRKRAAQELLEAKATAEVATTAKSAFLANMSHEIRTPLNAITGMAHLIRKSGVNTVQNDRLGKIEMAGAHLLEIINSILDLSKIEAGKFTLEEVALDVGAIVVNVVSILSQQAAAKKVDIEIDNQLSMNNFVGDPTRLQQGLLNFGSNAIKFSDKGRVTIHVKLLESDAETALLRFEVEDQGIGIEAATLSRLFSAFEQADNTTTRQYGGTGLGLAITKKLAQLMGGDAGATSELGHGSRFWFTARLRLGVQGATSQAPVPSLQAETILARDYADRKLLLVEDDLFNQEITLIILQEIWPVVDLAEDGLQAVERVKGNCYDLILMDMQMPRMDGLDATRQIRTLPNGLGVPVIAMTGNAFLEDRHRCYDAGMNDFLAKPVRPADLFEVILKWIRR